MLTLIAVVAASLITGVSWTLSSTYYINMSMFFAFAMLYPDATVLLLILPVKIKWLAWLDAALFAFDIVAALAQLNFVSALLPIVALLNFFLFSAKHFWAGCAAPPAGRHIRPLQNHSL